MGLILVPDHWGRQPPRPAMIDRSDPLADGLLFAHTGHPADGPRSLVEPYSSVSETSALYGVGVAGRGFIGDNAARRLVWTIPARSGWAGWTIAIIATPNSVTTNRAALMVGNGTTSNRLQIGHSATVWNAFGAQNDISGPAPTTGKPTVVAASSLVDTTSRLYVNGALAGNEDGLAFNTSDASWTTVAIGQRFTTSWGLPWSGHLTCALVWGRVLSPQEHAEFARNPWRLFKRDSRRLFFTSSAGVTIAANTGAATAAGLAATVNAPTVQIDGFAASGADLVITYTHTQVGTSPVLTASLERDGTPITDETTSTLSGTFTITNPGAGVYTLTLLDLTDSNGTATDGPWATDVTILGGDPGIECAVGEAVAAGLTAGIASPITVSAGTGAATAAGLSAGVASPITVSAGVGQATAAGLQASVDTGGVTINAGVGAAAGAGLTAGVSSPISIAAGVGAASASGYQASVGSGVTIPAGVGAATALGLTATVTAATHIVAGVGAASAAGFDASISSAQNAGRAASARRIASSAAQRSIVGTAASRRIN